MFKEEETENIDPKHIDALVVCLKITNSWVKRNLIDKGSSIDILYYDGFQRISLSIKDLKPISSILTSFTRESVTLIEIINIYMTFGVDDCIKIIKIKFLVVDISFAYNVIIW